MDLEDEQLLARLLAEYLPQEWQLVAELNQMKDEKNGIE